MDIQSLNLLSNIPTQNSIDTIANQSDNLSFSQIFQQAREINQTSAKEPFSSVFPANNVSVKAGNCHVASEIWQRKDFPVWRYFQDDVGADSLNNWKPSGTEPTGAESYIQEELGKISFGEMVVMIPDSLQKKMEADPAYAKDIAEKVQKWKEDYDRMDNAVAASYGDDPVLYQMTKSYCIQLDEEGNVENYAVVSGGMDTKKSDKTDKTEEKEPQKTIVRAAAKKIIEREMENVVVESAEADYADIASYFVPWNRKIRN